LSERNHHRMEIPADLARIGQVRRFAARCMARHRVPKRPAEEILLALSELVQNAVEHGAQGHSDATIRVRLAVSDMSVLVEVEDSFTSESKALELSKRLAQAGLPDDLESERGRGLFLVQTLMDRIEVVPLAQGGVVVRGEKRFTRRAR
jgi:anti-sigma regulatory factor (Ser/Thr protein kinase)